MIDLREYISRLSEKTDSKAVKAVNKKPPLCIHCEYHSYDSRNHTCFYPYVIDLVTGGPPKKGGKSCYIRRAPGCTCGIEGEFFEPKKDNGSWRICNE